MVEGYGFSDKTHSSFSLHVPLGSECLALLSYFFTVNDFVKGMYYINIRRGRFNEQHGRTKHISVQSSASSDMLTSNHGLPVQRNLLPSVLVL